MSYHSNFRISPILQQSIESKSNSVSSQVSSWYRGSEVKPLGLYSLNHFNLYKSLPYPFIDLIGHRPILLG
jgi:hypothetical protein